MIRLPGDADYQLSQQLRLPYTNGVVTAVVEYLCYNHVVVCITEVDGVATVPVQGVIHREDARYGLKDTDKLHRLFSPGDTLHGRILSLGNNGPLVISTADDAHGVVKAVDFKTLQEVRLARDKGGFFLNGVDLQRKAAKL